MLTKENVLLTSALLLLTAGALSAQDGLTARDAFWSSSDLLSVAPNPAGAKQPPAHTTSHTARAGDTGQAGTVAAGSTTRPILPISEYGYGAPPRPAPESQDRLGLRCSIMLQSSDGSFHEVPRDHIFHSGDRIRLGLLGNHPGYFYVIERGSSGEWSPVYPRPANGKDVNRIEAGKLETTRMFKFDQTPGEEQLFIIFSRNEIADIDKAIEGLQQQPTAQPHQSADVPLMEARNRISDAYVEKLVSRDLKLVDEETVTDSTTQQPGEQAVYVVAKAEKPEANQELVLSLKLLHE